MDAGENAFTWRMTELRRAAKKRIEAIQAEAVTRIERMSLDAQTELLEHAIETQAAHTFLAATKAGLDELMPLLVVAEVEQMIAPTLKRGLGHTPGVNYLN